MWFFKGALEFTYISQKIKSLLYWRRYIFILNKKFSKHEDLLLNYDDNSLYEKILVRILSTGESFGEYSLLDAKYKTTATILTKSVCEFACLDRKQYWNILGRIKRVLKFLR